MSIRKYCMTRSEHHITTTLSPPPNSIPHNPHPIRLVTSITGTQLAPLIFFPATIPVPFRSIPIRHSANVVASLTCPALLATCENSHRGVWGLNGTRYLAESAWARWSTVACISGDPCSCWFFVFVTYAAHKLSLVHCVVDWMIG